MVASPWSRRGKLRTRHDARQGVSFSDAELDAMFGQIKRHFVANGEMPTYREMAVMFDLASTSGVLNRLGRLAERGLLEPRPNGGYRIPASHLRIEYVGPGDQS